MIKAILIDYTGTLVHEVNEDIMAVVDIFSRHSNLKDPKQILTYWMEIVRRLERTSYGKNYISEEAIVNQGHIKAAQNIGLQCDHELLLALHQKFWSNSPYYEDTVYLLKNCQIPICIISNIENHYLEVSLKNNDLEVSGINAY